MSLSYATHPGDIDHLIADDHAIAERQLQHLEAGRGNRDLLVRQLVFELSMHAYAEATTLYPLYREQDMEPASLAAARGLEQMQPLLATLDGSTAEKPEFEDALRQLIPILRERVREEEQLELPLFRARVGQARMAELGREFIEAKQHAPTRPHPHAPEMGAAARVAGAVAKPIDMARDHTSGRLRRLATDASGLLDPQAQAITDAFASLEPLPVETLTPRQARMQPGPDDAVRVVMADRGIDGPEPVGRVENVLIEGPDGHNLPVRIYRPAGAGPDPLPILLWVHGGGWVLFTVDTYDASCRGLVNKAQCIVISPEYRRAPENVFPASHDDVLATWRWARDNASTFGGDPSRMAIGGESVGGNMAAATCLQLRAAGEPLPRFQALVYPVTTPQQFGASMEDSADARPLNRALLSWMAMHEFSGKPEAETDPRIDLLSLRREQLAGLPPAHVITDERDVLRSQGEQFAQNLQEAGVPTTHSYYDGVMHEFFGASAVLDKAERAQQEVADHLRRAFAGSMLSI
ncbi:MAG: hypothetical protein JWM90_1062 [Thermoleophilia bacterium]|nr:hypothetical protein [Thermoleophilia bacterium]